MWRHRCAGGHKKLYLRSGSQRHIHFVGFFNVPVLQRNGTTLFIRWFWHYTPLSRLLRHAGDTEDSRLKPPASSMGDSHSTSPGFVFGCSALESSSGATATGANSSSEDEDIRVYLYIYQKERTRRREKLAKQKRICALVPLVPLKW